MSITLDAATLRPYFAQFGYAPSSSLVTELQKQLKSMGIDPGPVDGVLGERTLAAVASASSAPSPALTAALEAARKGGVQLPGLTTPTKRDDLSDFFANNPKVSDAERRALSQLFKAPDAPTTTSASPEQASWQKMLDAQRATLNASTPAISLGADGKLLARGSSGNDRIQLTRNDGDVRVTISDRDSGRPLLERRFEASRVRGVTVDAGAGDDVIENGFRAERGVDGARLRGGLGTNVIYNNGEGALIQGSQLKPAGASGDVILNEGNRARIQGSSGRDYIVSNAADTSIRASSQGDLTALTGRNQRVMAGTEGAVVSNGANLITGVPSRVYSDPLLAGALELEAQQGANHIRQRLDALRPEALTPRVLSTVEPTESRPLLRPRPTVSEPLITDAPLSPLSRNIG